MKDYSEIAIHAAQMYNPDVDVPLAVRAWCLTCNIAARGSGCFLPEAYSLPTVLTAADKHLDSEQHQRSQEIIAARAKMPTAAVTSPT